MRQFVLICCTAGERTFTLTATREFKVYMPVRTSPLFLYE